jgi:hypothetical protein
MPIEIQCVGCGQKIRVGDEHAGKKARCPACGSISQVPSGGESAAPVPPTEMPGSSPWGSTGGTPEASQNPFADGQGASVNSYVSPANPYVSPAARPMKPHRGGLILTLAILGILCCMPLGIVAWILGVIDLGEMKRGQMDPQGQTLTQVGMVLGIVATVLGVLGGLFSVLASFS